MDTGAPASTAIRYRRGFLLYGAWLALGVPVALAALFIAFTARFVSEEPGVIIGLWALIIFFSLLLAAVITPLIERFSSNRPAIIVSCEGIKTRDMESLLPWDEIEKLTTRRVTSWAGKYTTTVNIFEILPKNEDSRPFRWRRLVDAHANPWRIAWHLLDRPGQLKQALEVHAPPALLAKSNLAGLPGA